MSKQVDERVVEMRFDNDNFERNVSESMSTLAKLKQSLNLTNAAKGLDEVSKSANNIDLSNISNSVSALEKRFSTLGIVGMRVIENLTDKVMSLTSRATSFFTSGIIQGGIKRATNLENAHFQLQGLLKDEEKVQAVMQNVKDSVDGTAYSLDAAANVASQLAASGMTAGENMYKSLRAVAGVAAMTNSSYEDIGRIFTQVAGNGRLMGDQLLQLSSRGMNAAATLATYLGKSEAEVRDMVSKGQISFQTFADAMDDAFGEHAKKANETFSGAMSNVKAALGRIGADFVSPLIEQNGPLVQFFNTLREQINAVKENLGPLTTTVTNFATKVIGMATNALKEFGPSSSSNSKWDSFIQKVNDAGISTENFQKKLTEVAKSHNVDLDKMIEKEGSFGKAIIKAFQNKDLDKSILSETLRSFTEEVVKTTETTEDMTKKVEDYGKIVEQVIRGDFGNAPERFKKLAEAGYDYATIQNQVNEKLGSSKRYTSELTEEQLKNADSLSKMSDEQLKSQGYTEDQIKAIKELADAADKAGTPVNELIESLDKPSGIALTFNTLSNIFGSLVKSVKAVGKAWKEIFLDGSTSKQLYNIVSSVNELSQKFKMSDETADKLTRTFKGLFAVLDILKTVGLELVNSVFKGFSSVAGAVNIDLLGMTASLGDTLVKFRDWVKTSGTITKAFSAVTKAIESLCGFVKQATKSFSELPGVQKIVKFFQDNAVDAFKKIRDSFKELVEGIKDGSITFHDIFDVIQTSISKFLQNLQSLRMEDIIQKFHSFGENIVDAFNSGVDGKISSIVNIMMEFANKIVNTVKEFLGIHSPSTVFIAIGAMIVAGLVVGISDNLPSIEGAFGNVVDTIKNIFSNVDWSAILSLGYLVGLFVIVDKLIDSFNKLVAPFDGVNNVLNGVAGVLKSVSVVMEASKKSISKVIKSAAKVVKSVANVINANAFKIGASAVKDLAISIAILVGSLTLLTMLDSGKLNTALVQLTYLSALLMGLSMVVGYFNKGSATDFVKITGSLLGVSASLLIMSKSLKNIASIDADRANQAMLTLATMVGMIILVIMSMAQFVKGESQTTINRANKLFIKMAGALVVMALVVKLLGSMDGGDVAKGLIAVECLTLVIAELMAITKLAGKNVGKIGSTLLSISASMAIMVIVIKMLSKLEAGEIAKGLTGMALFGLVIAEFIAISRLAPKGEIAKVGTALLAMSASLIIMVKVVKMMSELDVFTLAKGITAIQWFAVVIAELVAITRLGGKETTRMGATLLAMSVSIGILAAIAIILGMVDTKALAKGVTAVSLLGAVMTAMIWATRGANNVKANLIVMSVAIGVMAGAVALLSFLDTKKLAGATACMSILMGVFALMAKMSGQATKAMGSLIVMTAAVGLMAGILAIMTTLPTDQVLPIAASLAMLMTSMSLVLAAIKKSGDVSLKAVGSLALIGAVVLELGGILAIISKWNISTSFETVSQISILLLTMSAAMAIASLAGKNAVGASAAMLIMGVVVGELGVVLGLLSHFDVNLSLETVTSLSVLLLAMSACLGVLSLLRVNLKTGIDAALGLATFVGIMAVVIAAFGALSKIDGFNTLIKDGGESLALVGYAIGKFVGSIVGGFSAGATSGLPEIGENLSKFMENLQGFLDGASDLDTGLTAGVESLAKAILTITAADLLQRLLTFGDSGAGDAVQSFCEQLQPLGEGIKKFSDSVKGITEDQVNSMSSASSALEALANVAKAIPSNGGWKEKILGAKDISEFANQLEPLGKGIVAFGNAVKGIDSEGGVSSKTISAASDAIDEIVKIIKKLPYFKGVATTDFTNNIEPLGKGIAAFANSVSGITADAATSIGYATKGLTKLAEIADIIPRFKTMSIDNFTGKLEPLGAGIKSFALAVSGISNYSEDISSSVSAIRKLISVINDMSGLNIGGVDTFNSAINKLSTTNVKGFVSNFSGVNSSDLTRAGSEMISSIVSGLKSKQSSLNTAMSAAMKTALTAIKNKYSEFKLQGTILIAKLIAGMNEKKPNVKSAATSSISGAITGIKGYYSNFYSAGKYLGEGLVLGISAKQQAVYNAAYALGQKAVQGEKDGQASNSPSKLTIKAGKWLGEGLIIGIRAISSNVYKEGFHLGDETTNAVSSAMSRISQAFDDGMELTPTIRPVLDLNNVSSGVDSISSMLNLSPSLGSLSSIGTVSRLMSARNQNGTNEDVISAINSLGKKLGNVGNTTYNNIGGITYDDGSNVSNAVETLIRACGVERRR